MLALNPSRSVANPSQTMSGNASTLRIIWSPQPGPQKALIDCPLPEVFYGGARGGGKTDGVLGKYAIKANRYGSAFNGVFFRRELPMLDDAIERSHEIYGPLGATWNDQKKRWRFPNGARLRFRPLESVQDAEKYQGQNITDATVEEAGNYPDPAPIDRLNGVLRSAAGVPTQLLLTGNPGGPGQQWIAARYVNPCPLGMKVLARKLPNGREHRYVYIPSRLENNRILMAKDPDYVNRLYLVGSPQLVEAWLKGDWSQITGAYFPEFSLDKHVIPPFEIPKHWARFRSFDWGSAKPFSVGWWAVASEETRLGRVAIPRGALVRYREWYGVLTRPDGSFEPNVGLKMLNTDIAKGIAERSAGEEYVYSVADPAIFAEDGGPSIAEQMWVSQRINFTRADNARIAGWQQLRDRLGGEDHPMIFFFSTCIHTIRTIPTLQHDKTRQEDIDTDAEDHAADECRYAAMSRPWARPMPIAPRELADLVKEKIERESQISLGELTRRHIEQWRRSNVTGRI